VPVALFDQVTVPAQPLAVSVAFSPSHTVALSALTDGAAGFTEVPMVTGLEAGEVPQLVVQVAVYVPAPTCTVAPFPIVTGAVVPGLYQVSVPVQPVAVSVAFSSPQTAPLLVVTDGATGAFSWPITSGPADTVPPQLVVQVAVYVPAPACRLFPLAPVDQVTVPPSQPVAVRVAFSVPHTLAVLVAMVKLAGALSCVMVTAAETADVPHTVTQVAVYVPAVTTCVVPVPPFDQWIVPPAQPVAVKVAVSLPQRTDLLVVSTGASGLLPSPITIGADASDEPQAFTQVAV